MNYFEKTIVPVIESHYETMSSMEKNIADFFINNRDQMDFSSKNISAMLYVSEAALSRFAKKCGYKGYREFIYHYKESLNESRHTITNQMRIVFDAYQELLNKGFNEGWIDVYENEGKRSGAYSWGAYGTHPYVLLNHQDNMNSMFTLAHEMGHAMHTYYSNKKQPFTYADYLIFVAEVASTVNETLFGYYMLEKADTNDEKKFIISEMMDSFKATLYRQTMFAEFEQLIYNAYENGTILTSEFLCNEYLNLNKKYFGNGVNVNEEIKYEWARIPHFYYNFYVYQYATGIAAAYYIVNRIRNGEENAVSDYLKFLSAGDSVDPVEALKLAGVDMTNPDVVNNAIDMFGNLIDMYNELK